MALIPSMVSIAANPNFLLHKAELHSKLIRNDTIPQYIIMRKSRKEQSFISIQDFLIKIYSITCNK